MADRTRDQKVIHALALVTAIVSLAPIGLGSLVTTLGAGMAFIDWPTSDGDNMLLYNFLVDLRQGRTDRFVEHSHRLAGVLIGLCSIALCVAAWKLNGSKSVRIACSLVLAGVIVQGMIGGLRVLLDRQAVAFGHSVFGCCVFVGLWMVASMTSRGWKLSTESGSGSGGLAAGLAVVYPAVCLVQYVLGGFIRHLGGMLHAHVAGAGLVLFGAVVVVLASLKIKSKAVRSRSWLVGAAVAIQIGIGLFTWVTKYGFPPVGWVAVQHSLSQVISRTTHTVAGMVVVATACSWAVTVIRINRLQVDELAGGESASLVHAGNYEVG